MRIMRLGDRDGRKTPCLMEPDGTLRDVSGHVRDISPETLADGALERLAELDPRRLPKIVQGDKRIAPPVALPRNIWCIGLNYSDHAEESGMEAPKEPILFNKSSGAFCGAFDEIPYTERMSKLDWEVELGIVIGQMASDVTVEDAMDHVAGFTVVNDVSERSWQLDHGGQWAKGKSARNFCPTGPWLVTPDEAGDVQALDMYLDLNGERMQSGTTAKMIFDCATIVSYLSRFADLEPGDLICTGTPPGVGMGHKPPRYLQPGDVVTLGVTGLGEQRQEIVAARR